MRTIAAAAILAAAFAASPGSAQDMMNSPGPNGMPMPNPAQDYEEAMRRIDERGHLDDIELARAGRESRTAWLERQAVARRAQATEQAAALTAGTAADPGTAASIREALEKDLDDWRKQFDVGRREWRTMRATWLPEGSFTAEEWAARRVEWFEARDAWIAAH
jgi:hypothetical protein